jgi:hypothetical protein
MGGVILEYDYPKEVRKWGSSKPPFQFDEGFREAHRGLG